MAAKQIEVLKWLEEIVDSSEIPPFEKNEANIEKLYQLMISFREANFDVKEVDKYLRYKTQCYEHEGNLLDENLKELQISLNSLSAEEQSCLNSYSSLCTDLNLHSILPSNVILAINSLEEEHRKGEESLLKEKRFTDNILELSKGIAHNLEELKRISENAKQTSADQEEEYVRDKMKQDFNKEKLKKYQADIKSFQGKLNKSGYEEDLKFADISKRIEEISRMKEELENKEKTLESYTLPPDLTLAEAKVEETRQCLAMLMKQIVHDYASKS